MGRLNYSSVDVDADYTLCGTGGEDTDYTSVIFNGYLDAVQYTTTLSAATTIFNSTAKVYFRGERTGITYYSGAIGTAGWTLYPRSIAHSSSGGAIGVSTDYNFIKFPIVQERVKVLTSGMSTAANHAGTFVIITEGA